MYSSIKIEETLVIKTKLGCFYNNSYSKNENQSSKNEIYSRLLFFWRYSRGEHPLYFLKTREILL